ncbi:MFS transporter [Streptomyces sp. NPDC102467]|uniref:MFS transporter n=1 Tax=Streptomyces sp. NPDC102467 TaxID=3366179 RepID=UPI0037F82FDB
MSDTTRPVSAPPLAAAAPEGSDRSQTVSLILIVGCQLMVAIGFSSVNVSLPGIRAGLGLTVTELSWVTNLYMLSFAGLLLLGGRVGDLLGRRRAFLGGIGLFTASSLLGAVAHSAPVLLTALVGQGIGAAFAEPASLSLIAVNFAEGPRRNRALAVFATAAGLGLAAGMLVGGLLSEISWRAALFVNVPIGLIILIGTPFVLHESTRHRGRFDLAGALTATGGVIALVYAISRAGTDGWGDGLVLWSFAAAAVLLAAAIAAETRAAHPLVPPRLLRDRRRALAYLQTIFVGTVGAALLFCLAQFLEDVAGFSPVRTGLGFLPMACTLFGAAAATPALIARRGAKAVVVLGALLLTLGTGWLSALSQDTAYFPGIAGPLLLIGAGQGSSITALNSLILARVQPGDAGAASGLQQSTMRLGAALGLAAAVTVYGASDGGAEGFGDAFAFSSGIIGVGLLVSVFLLRDNKP